MTPTTLVSVEEYLRTSYPEADREYVDGEVVERNVGELDHSDVQSGMLAYLRSHYGRFWAGVEVRVQITSTRFRVPDVVLIAGPKPPGQIITSPPHLVVEVLSPDDRAAYMQQKVTDYLTFGVPCVWTIDPLTRQAWIYTRDGGRPVTDGVLRAQNPDIEVPIEQLFA